MKLPTIRQLPSGSWFCQLRLDGQSISITETTRERCEAKAMAYKTGILTARRMPHAITLGGDILGNITRMDNALANIAGEVVLLRAEIADNQEQMERARADMEAPFSKEDELTQKTARLKQLNILLNMDQKDKNLIDDSPEAEALEMQKVRGQAR